MNLIRRGIRGLDPRPVSWTTVLVLSTVLTLTGTFWLETVQGAVGAIERSQGPFRSFVENCFLLLPVMVVVVLAALALTRRLLHGLDNRVRTVVAASLLVALAGTLTGLSAMGVQAWTDYGYQAKQLAIQAKWHGNHGTVNATGNVPHDPPGVCLMACQMQRQTVDAHLKSLRLAGGWLLLTDLAAVGWVMALKGGTLVGSRDRRRTGPAASAPAVESIPAGV